MMPELSAHIQDSNLPELVLHEYVPCLDSSDLGPDEYLRTWRVIYNTSITCTWMALWVVSRNRYDGLFCHSLVVHVVKFR
jgi:hypothetical protein